MPKFKVTRGASNREKHAPLAEQILAGNAVRAGTREKRRGREVEEEEEYVGPRLSRRILQQARQQQEELETDHGAGDRSAPPRERATRLGPGLPQDGSDEEDEEWPTLEKAAKMAGVDHQAEVIVDPEDERAIEMFMNKNPPVRRTLADIIMEKLTEKRQLPVLWHQCLLTLAQRYKADLATEQKEALLELLRLQPHPQLSPEIRRELQSAVPRDVEDGGVTME